MDLRFLAVIFLVIAVMEAIGKLLKKARLAEADEEQQEEVPRPQESPRPRDPLAEVFRDLRMGQLGDDVVKPAGQMVREALAKAVPAEDAADAGPLAAKKADAPDNVPLEPPPWEPRRQPGRDPATVPSPQGVRPTAPTTSPVPAPATAAAARQHTPRHEPTPAMVALRRRAGSDGIATVPTPGSLRVSSGDGAFAAYISPTTLRRLVVAREVLGPPVALRADQDPVDR
ncbi:MAG: hypothetical protein J4F34_04675 [Gemmatimonadetes bacterium]|nr:hypothetical protein [Gemmatimonadota bacterium]